MTEAEENDAGGESRPKKGAAPPDKTSATTGDSAHKKPAISRGRAIRNKLIALVLSLLFAAIVAEVGLRVVMPKRPYYLVWPAKVKQVFRPNHEVFPLLPTEAVFETNTFGIRGKELGKDEDEVRVLSIGGSTTECLYHAADKAWTHRIAPALEQALSARSDPRHAWVGSVGRSGMNSRDHVLHAQYFVPQLPRIDVVVLLAGVNDLVAFLGQPETYTVMDPALPAEKNDFAIRRAFLVIPGRLADAWDYEGGFYKRLALYQLGRGIRQRWSQTNGASTQQAEDGQWIKSWRENRQKAGHIVDKLPDLTQALGVYRQNLTATVALLRARGVRPLLVTQPTFWRADLTKEEESLLWMGGIGEFQREPGHDYYAAGALASGMLAFNEAMLDVCKQTGAECLDLAAKIPKTADVFYDDCHFGEKGAGLIGDAVADAIRQAKPF